MKILFIDGTIGFEPNRLKEKPTGGILTSLTLIPRYLADKHEVTVASAYEKEEKIEGVLYTQKIIGLDPDVVVFNRNMINHGLIDLFPKAKKIWWLHDIVDHRYLDDDAFIKVDKIVALSEYCKRAYMDFYDIQADKFTIIPNGVDKSTFYKGNKKDKEFYLMASAPIKGMYPVAFAWYNLKRLMPEFRLKMYCSQSLHGLENGDMQKQLDQFKEMGIEVLEPISQKELAEEIRKAWAVLMPNHYPEICSNLMLQAIACETPVISTPIGSMTEYIKGGKNGLLTSTYPHDMFWWWKDFALQCINIQNLSFQFDNMPSWEDIGQKWEEIIGSSVN